MPADLEARVAPSAARYGLRLEVFDLSLDLRSDSPRCIEAVAALLGRFVADGTRDPGPDVTRLVVLTQPGEPYGVPIASVDDVVYPLQPGAERLDPSHWAAFTYFAVCRIVAERVRTHFLIHGAALSHRGQGIVLAGDPGHGKSTLTLALVRRGCRFLSDEFAALGRADRLLHPFPRNLQLVAGTLERTGYAEIAHVARPWLDKLVLDVDALGPDTLGEPAPLHHVVVLRGQESGASDARAPSFALSPRLVPCSHDRAALQLLKRYHYGGVAALLQGEYAGSSLRLYMDLMAAIQDATCHELFVGQLDPEVDLLWNAIGGE